jgi:uncharacterized membrane protein YccF (DUF307 family)
MPVTVVQDLTVLLVELQQIMQAEVAAVIVLAVFLAQADLAEVALDVMLAMLVVPVPMVQLTLAVAEVVPQGKTVVQVAELVVRVL